MEQSTTTQAYSDHKIETLLDKFYHWEQTQPDQVFLRQPEGDQWKDYTWREVGQQARRMASALRAMQLPPRSNIGLISKNCAHWMICDLAIFMSGHVSVPFYPTLQAEKLQQVLSHSGCKVLFIGKLDDWEGMKAGVPEGVSCIRFPQHTASATVNGHNIQRWEDLLSEHEPMRENYQPSLQDLATIIYTSGTTGMPKGVMYTYYTFSVAINHIQDIFQLNSSQNRYFSYLPLCHIAERNIVECAGLYSGGTIHFSESLATFAQNLRAAQPTHFLAVPRIWTKFQLGILSKMPQAKLDAVLSDPNLAEQVKEQLQTSLGLAQAEVILTGAAPMPSSLIDWYKKVGIHIQEVYGMTENVGLCTYMRKDRIKMGTVGQPYPGVEIRIDQPSGEILMQAPWVMTGYYKNPQKTAEVLKDGWLHTGDMGTLDEENFLTITGRVKDTFKSAKGEFIVPAPIEYQFATNSNVEQVCILGRGLPQPVALVVLSEIGQQLDKENLVKSLSQTRGQINQSVLKHEQVQRIVIMQEPWDVNNGMLTPTLKVKRNILEEKYEAHLPRWYQQAAEVIWED